MLRRCEQRVMLGFVLLLVLAGCVSTRDPQTGSVHHLVLCWLKAPGDDRVKAQIVQVSQGFVDIPGVVSVSAGSAVPSARPVVDSSFDVAILIVLEDEAALQHYLEHPKHRFAQQETLRPLVDRIVVYDFVVGRGR